MRPKNYGGLNFEIWVFNDPFNQITLNTLFKWELGVLTVKNFIMVSNLANTKARTSHVDPESRCCKLAIVITQIYGLKIQVYSWSYWFIRSNKSTTTGFLATLNLLLEWSMTQWTWVEDTDLSLPTSSLWDAAAAKANLRFPSRAVNLYNN